MDPVKEKEVLQYIYSLALVYKVLITLVLKRVFFQISTSKVSAILRIADILTIS